MHPVHLAQYLVNRFGFVPGGITPLKAQKLVYYVKAWGLVDGHDLVDGQFEKWPFGPVNPDLYHHFKAHGRQPLQPVGLCPEHEPQGKARDFVEFVGASYVRFPAITLSVMTHREDPWKLTPDEAVIAEDLMRVFYAKHPFAQNLPFERTGKPYYPVQSDLDRAFTMDMGKADAARAATYTSFEEYLGRLQELERKGLGTTDGWMSRLLA